MTSGEALELVEKFRASPITSKSIQGVVPRRSGGSNRRSNTDGASLGSCSSYGHG